MTRRKQKCKDDEALIAFLKNIFGFNPGNIFLYKQAMRHKSIASTIKEGVKDSNERLEFLGDAVLSAIVANYLFRKFPFREEGFLTETRSKIVSRASLNKLAFRIGMGNHLSVSPDLMKHSSASLLGDALEALIGAMYLDKGFDFTSKTIITYLLDIYMDITDLIETEVNFKSRLIEWGQHHKKEIEFRIGNALQLRNQQRQYRIQIVFEGTVISEAIDFSIKGAEQLAAEKALAAIVSGEITQADLK